jgi:hypothetical protein
MTAKEKAIELVDKYYGRDMKENLPLTIYWSSAKACALIATDEILSIVWLNGIDVEYWVNVKKEIEKL